MEGVVGVVDHIDDRGISGWAYSVVGGAALATLRLAVDGEILPDACVTAHRPDVAHANDLRDDAIGFVAQIPLRFHDDRPHVAQLFAGTGAEALTLIGPHGNLKSEFPFTLRSFSFRSEIDGFRDGAIRGWAFIHDKAHGRHHVGCMIAVRVGNVLVGKVRSNEFRPDVAQAYGCPPLCGFSFVPPAQVTRGAGTAFRFSIAETEVDIQGSPVIVDRAEDKLYEKLYATSAAVEALFVQIWRLRADINAMLPKGPYNLSNYDTWAKSRLSRLPSLLRASIDRTPELARTDRAKVSIVMPVYRPRPDDLRAAVLSALGQTYDAIEVVIVDDHSDRPEIAELCLDLCRRDRRIIFKTSDRNAGISECTNVCLAECSGDYVIFFDHDDLLVPEAVEIMVLAAQQSGALVIYSDEDKIDDDGVFSEPNFKPDFNYRLLLCQNYICHLLMVRRDHLAKVLPLQGKYDGAQDHDVILRLAEITDPAQIFHVPEVLYHWRKTPSSTASTVANKGYAMSAGIAAVSDHLRRTGKQADVTALGGATFYSVKFIAAQRPRIQIIIPFHEQCDVTELCCRSIVERTSYRNYEITLVDNMSVSDRAAALKRALAAMPNTTLIDFNEPFNYSRINNTAARRASTELILFLNNDVIITQDDWLDRMVGELEFDDVGAVGCKLVYPTGYVQHGGIILGVGGVADHAFRGVSADHPGYVARAVCAQEYSAVTGACLLCRRDVFELVGGFDEDDLAVAFNDVDLCLKMGTSGYRIVWTPDVVLEHHESLSRGSDFAPAREAQFFAENAVMMERWADIIRWDPHYNVNFARRGNIFSDLADPDQAFDW